MQPQTTCLNRIHPSLEATQVAWLKVVVMGFRGDWKAFKQVFNLKRWYNVDEA